MQGVWIVTAPNSWRQHSTKALNELLGSESKGRQLYKKTLSLSSAVALFDSCKTSCQRVKICPREWLLEIYDNPLMWSSLHAEAHLSWAACPTAVMPRVFHQCWAALLPSWSHSGLGYSMKAKNKENNEQKWNWRKQNSRAIGQRQKNVSLSCVPQHSIIPIYLPLTKPPTRLS